MISTDRKVHVVITDAETGAVIDSRTLHDDYLLIAAGEWQVEAFRAHQDRHELLVGKTPRAQSEPGKRFPL